MLCNQTLTQRLHTERRKPGCNCRNTTATQPFALITKTLQIMPMFLQAGTKMNPDQTYLRIVDALSVLHKGENFETLFWWMP